jgi:two-component sensor histidine kinase
VSVQSAFPDINTMTMTISDDGEGFKAQTESKRHGLGLVRRLVEQVRGTASLDSENGTVWTIKIPVPPSASLSENEPNIIGVDQEAA